MVPQAIPSLLNPSTPPVSSDEPPCVLLKRKRTHSESEKISTAEKRVALAQAPLSEDHVHLARLHESVRQRLQKEYTSAKMEWDSIMASQKQVEESVKTAKTQRALNRKMLLARHAKQRQELVDKQNEELRSFDLQDFYPESIKIAVIQLGVEVRNVDPHRVVHLRAAIAACERERDSACGGMDDIDDLYPEMPGYEETL